MSSPPATSVPLSRLLAHFDVASSEGIAAILDDAASLRILTDQLAERERAYSNAQRLFSHIPPPDDLCLLIDFDVLRAYIEDERSSRRDFLEIKYFFECSTIPCMLPVGTVRELTQYLNDQGFFSHRKTDPDYIQAREAVDLIGVAQGNVEAAPPTAPADRFLRYERLRTALKRCHGVEDKHSDTTFRYFFDTLEDVTSRDAPNTPRDWNNRNDAMNLAVTLHPWERDASTERVVYYLLLSCTGPVHNVSSDLRSRSRSRGQWLTLRPTQALLLDLLDYFGNPVVAQSHATNFHAMFQKLFTDLTHELNQLTFPGRRSHSGSRHKAIAQKLRSAFSSLTHERVNLQVEQWRSSFSALSNAYSGPSTPTDISGQAWRTNFVKTLDALRKLLDDLSAITYKVSRRSTGAANLERFELVEGGFAGEEPLCIIERFEHPELSGYWKFEWRHDEPEQALVETLCAVASNFGGSSGESRNPVDRDAHVQIAHDPSEISRSTWLNGIVVFIDDFVVGFPAWWSESWNDFRFLERQELSDIIRSSAESLPPTGRDSVLSAICGAWQIDEIQVNCPAWSLTFETFPSEDRFFRSCSMYMPKLALDQFVKMFERLGPRVILRKSFSTALEAFLVDREAELKGSENQ